MKVVQIPRLGQDKASKRMIRKMKREETCPGRGLGWIHALPRLLAVMPAFVQALGFHISKGLPQILKGRIGDSTS
jgi:hypothetical protein